MFKVEQFSVTNEAAINQFAHFAQLSLANLEKFAEIGLDAARAERIARILPAG